MLKLCSVNTVHITVSIEYTSKQKKQCMCVIMIGVMIMMMMVVIIIVVIIIILTSSTCFEALVIVQLDPKPPWTKGPNSPLFMRLLTLLKPAS